MWIDNDLDVHTMQRWYPGLLEAHREELTTNKDLLALAPDWDQYRELLRSGAAFAQGLYLDDTALLVGYCVTFIGPHLHYSSAVVAQNDVLYLDPAYRRGRSGLVLMAAAEAEAKRRGACLYFWHAKPDTPLDRLLRIQQLPVQDTIYGRRL